MINLLKRFDNWMQDYGNIAVFFGVLLALALGGYSWINEHDARIKAEQTVKESAARVSSLEDKIKAADASGKAAVKAIEKKAAAVKTPEQAIQAIPDLSSIPLTPRKAPDSPTAVEVEAVPLVQELAACKEGAVNLGTCETKLALKDQIITEKDEQIKALSGKKSFWKRLGGGVKAMGCAAGGAGLGAIISGGKGAAIGAAGGVGVCALL